jgi:predicted DNA-binding protein with PD1-like motif
MLLLEEGDDPVRAVESFASEKGVVTAQVFAVDALPAVGILIADLDGQPRFRIRSRAGELPGGEMIVQEIVGIGFRRMMDPASGKEILTRLPSSRTRVMEKPAAEPESVGPATVPVYLVNAEFT